MQPATENPVDSVSTQRPMNAPENFWAQEKPADPTRHDDDDDGDDVLTGLPYLDVGDENRVGYKNTNATMQGFFGSSDGGAYDAFASFGRVGPAAGGHTEVNNAKREESSGAHPIGSERSSSSFVAPMPTFGPKPSHGSSTSSPTPKPDAASAASDSQQLQQLHANAAPWAPTPSQQQPPYQQQQYQQQQQPAVQQHGQPRYSHQGGPKPRPLPLPYPDAFGTSDRPLEDMLLESKRYVDFVSSVPLEQVMAWYRQNHVGSIVPPYTTPGVEQTGVERRQVFVGQLPSYLTEEGLTACLEYVYGTPNSVAFTLIRRSASQRTAPYGLVTLTSPQLVDAFRGLNRSIYVGRQNLFFANRLDQAAYTLEGNTEFQRFVSQLVECDMSRHVADQRTLGYARAAMVVGLANPPPRLTRAPQGQHQAQPHGRGYGSAPNVYAAPSTHGATHAAPPSYHNQPSSDFTQPPPRGGAPRHGHHPHHQQQHQYQQHGHPQQQRPPPPQQQPHQHHAYAAPPPGAYSHPPPPPPPPSYHPPQYHAPPPAPAAAPPAHYGYAPPPALQQHSHPHHGQTHSPPHTASPPAPIATLSLRQAAATGPLYMMNADGHLVPVQVVGSNNPSPTVSPCNRHDGAPEVFGLLRPGGDAPLRR